MQVRARPEGARGVPPRALAALMLLGLLVGVGGDGEAGAGAGFDDGAAGDAFVQFLLDMEDTGRVLPVEGSNLVLENDRGKLILVERHTDGGALIPGRSAGNFDVRPYVSVSMRHGAGADARGIRVEWKVGNCEVGPDSAFSVALLDGWPIGFCWSPHCYTHLLPPGAGARGERGGEELAIVLLQTDEHATWVKTPVGARVPLTWPGPADNPQVTARRQTCLPEPAASGKGELYVVDVVYSMVHRQLVLFGPTHKPLGGLYCEWDGNPQTSKTARKVCHPGRIAPELQRSWIWSRPPDGSWVTNIKGRRPRAVNASDGDKPEGSMIFQCVFPATASRGVVTSNATLIEDNQLSHNLATCFPPDDIRLLLMAEGGDAGRAPWTGGDFVFRAWDEMSGESLAEVRLRLCPFMVSSVKRWEHETSICAIFRDQAPYLAEWVEYHLLAGVEHFYLYNHKSVDNATAELEPFVRAGVVDLHQWDLLGHPQKEAFLHCTHKYGHESRWMAMIDVDEFLLAGDGQTRDVREVLEHFDAEGQVLYVQEMFYGHQGFLEPPGGLVIENYLNHSDDITQFEYRKKYIFRPAEGHIYVPCIHDIANGYFEPTLLPPDVLRINHYTVKSKRHWAGDHIKRYQPCTDEWNEVQSAGIRDAYLVPLRLALCLRLGRMHCGTRVLYLPPLPADPEAADATCTQALQLCPDFVAMRLGERAGRSVVWAADAGQHMGAGPEAMAGGGVSEGAGGGAREGTGAGEEAERYGAGAHGKVSHNLCDACGSARGLEISGGAETLATWLGCLGVGAEGQAVVRDGGVLGEELLAMTALEVTETLGASLGTAQLVLSCVSQPMLADEPRERVAARDQAAGDAEDVPGVPDGEPMIVIDSPLEGETVLVASVTFSVKNMPEWEQSCVVSVFLDTTVSGHLDHVAMVESRAQMPVVVDRNRSAHPFGPSWHTLLVHLLHADDVNGPPLAQARRRVRYTGPRKIVHSPRAVEAGMRMHNRAGVEQGQGKARVSRRFPQVEPLVCCGFVSSGRLHLLRRSLVALVRHFEEHEPAVSYELAWVDNDSGPDALEVYREFDFERVTLYRVNYGATHAFNTLLFDLCRRSEFVMTMEEDWEWIAERSHKPAVAWAMHVLREDSLVLGVLLRQELDYKASLSEWITTKDGTVEYRRHCRKPDGMGWGAWTNGAAVWKRHELEAKIGRQNEDWGDGAELEYAQRVGQKFCTAQLRLEAACETTACNSAARHIGEAPNGTLLRSPGWESHIVGFE